MEYYRRARRVTRAVRSAFLGDVKGSVFQAPEAVADVREIADYIAADNLPAAERWLQQLDELFGLLARRPFLGERYRSRRHGALRRFTFGSYVVYYQPRNEGVAIVRVLHGARDERRQF